MLLESLYNKMDKKVRADQNEKMSSDMMPVGFGTWKIPRDVTATVVQILVY